MKHKISNSEISVLDSSSLGPDLEVLKPKEKEREHQTRKKTTKPAAPGDTI